MRRNKWAVALIEIGLIAIVFAVRVTGVLPLPAWPFLLLIAAIFGFTPWRVSQGDPAEDRSPARMIAIATVVGVGYQFFTIFVEGPLLAWIFGEPETPPQVDGLVGNTAALIGFLALVTVFSVGEELAFRGYLLDRIRAWMGESALSSGIALLVSSAAFGAMHTWQNLPGITGTAISGLLFGGVYLWFRADVRAAIVVHLAVNVTGVFLAYFGLFIS